MNFRPLLAHQENGRINQFHDASPPMVTLGVRPSENIERTLDEGRNDKGDRDRKLFVRSTLIGSGVAAVPYLLILWGGRLNPLRTSFPGGLFSNFYEIQARALMHGHWNIPPGSLNIEAFVVHGRSYMYFGPLPSLLRLPIMMFTSS